MNVLVFGGSGLVGSRFLELNKKKKRFEIISPSFPGVDLTNKKSLSLFLQENSVPSVMISFAAYTDVSEGENQRGDKNGDCWKVNVEGVKNLVSFIDPSKTHLIHLSTDMVFSGSKGNPGPYSEDQIPDEASSKLTWYGYTKAEGERIVREKLGNKATILRLIYPVRAKYDIKLDYLRKPLSLYDAGKLYPMFDDQQVSITFIDEACLALNKIIDKKLHDTFHAGTPDVATPYELISYTIEKTRGVKGVVKPSSLDEFLKTVDNPVRYPKYSGLKVEKTQRVLKIKFSPWRRVVDELVKQGLGK